MVIAAIGVFAYNKYLYSTLSHKQAQLVQAQAKVDDNTIEDFVRLRDRLSNGKDLLTNHVVLSQYFDVLESLTLQNVSFSEMHIAVAGDHTATLTMKGTARNFNALAAQSNAFAGEKRIKRAIFSDINLTTTKLVSFSLTADIDSKLIVAGTAVSPSVPVTTTTTPPPAATVPVVPATTTVPVKTSTTPVKTGTATTTP
ncbi:MAG: putative pilN [Parcubacteria group bacterium]|nr:putative pilN [Parcubacteria group bacterium]